MSNNVSGQQSDKNSGTMFSVIIPVYNGEQTIERAIDSVLSQSYTNFEIIVVDDASTDKTREVLENKYSSNIWLIQKVVNSGGSVARNSGMDVATGNYIAFLDADDAWHKDKLLLVKTILESRPEIKLFYHPYTFEDIGKKKLPEDIVVYRLPFVKLLPANIIATPCTVISNDPSFRFEPSMRYSEDYDLWLRIGYTSFFLSIFHSPNYSGPSIPKEV
jgi:glycosyltransferase involved in cell wall biosynthesis